MSFLAGFIQDWANTLNDVYAYFYTASNDEEVIEPKDFVILWLTGTI